MGGLGSGRVSYWEGKRTIEDFNSIDIRRWKRDGLLTPWQAFNWQWSRLEEVTSSIQVWTEPDRVLLIYRYRRAKGDWEEEKYPVHLYWTTCHLGGQRPWFLCPACGCGKRVAVLYGGRTFACRQCYGLAYPSQREAGLDRAVRRAERIRAKLQWLPGILNGEGLKPKGMHWRTFDRLKAQHEALAQYSREAISGILRSLGERPERWI